MCRPGRTPQTPAAAQSPHSDASWEFPFTPGGERNDEASQTSEQVELNDSDTSEEGSAQSTSGSEVELGENGGRNFELDLKSDFYINNKSVVIHCCKMPGVLKCGRKIAFSFSTVYEQCGIRCSRRFDV